MKKIFIISAALACALTMAACGKTETYTTEIVTETIPAMELDVWHGIEVNFSGISPNGKAEIEKKLLYDTVEKKVQYTIDKSDGLSNGDVVTVSASIINDPYDLNTYSILEPTKEFTVSGLKSYLNTTDGYDMSEADTLLNGQFQTLLENCNNIYGIGSKTSGHRVFQTKSLDDWEIIKNDIQAEKSIFLYNQNTNENIYATYWNLNLTLEKKKFYLEYTNEYSDEYNIGDIIHSDVYLAAYMDNILVNADGTLDTSNSKLHFINCSTPSSITVAVYGDFYVDKTIDECVQELLDEYPEYTLVE